MDQTQAKGTCTHIHAGWDGRFKVCSMLNDSMTVFERPKAVLVQLRQCYISTSSLQLEMALNKWK